MNGWVSVAASLQGKRKYNEDSVFVEPVGGGQSSAIVMIGCDGVGSLSGSGETAAAVVKASVQAIATYLRGRGRFSLPPFEHLRLAYRLRRLKLPPGLTGASTLAAAVVPTQYDAKRILTFAVGDTRIYFLHDRKGLVQMTRDDHDRQGSLTAYVTGRGRVVVARSLLRHARLHRMRGPPRAIVITTDGIHEQCKEPELEAFLRYCIKDGVSSPKDLADLLSTFLHHNLSDNASICLHYRI
jgi:serine/threonine protein phosphatase PrpC